MVISYTFTHWLKKGFINPKGKYFKQLQFAANILFVLDIHIHDVDIRTEEASFARFAPIMVELLYFPSSNSFLCPIKLVFSNISQQHGPSTSKELSLSSKP